MLGQDRLAQTRFECALALNPDYLPAAMWLGDLHYRAGRLPEAIAIYETARERSPDERQVQQLLDGWRKEYQLQSRFHESRSQHFVAMFERKSDEALARQVVDRLEAAYWRVGNTLGVYPSQPITVVLYTREQFSEITRLAGLVSGRLRRAYSTSDQRLARTRSRSSIASCRTSSFMPSSRRWEVATSPHG